MTATDMHMMRRLGAPSVSPDGRYAIFTLSTTDLAANKRNNVVHILDLKARGAAPQPLAGATSGAHDAVFGADGAIWYLAPVGGQDQLFRMAVRRPAGAAIKPEGRYFRFQGQRRRQPADPVGRPRPALRRLRLRELQEGRTGRIEPGL